MLWAITSYFNPASYESRNLNYRIFRERLSVPLIAVELARDPSRFELRPGDADVLVQIVGEDRLWQKERLLNVALDSLPQSCEFVAWIDCDVIFEDGRWAERACESLRALPLVQLFERFRELRPSSSDPSDPREPVGDGFSLAARLQAVLGDARYLLNRRDGDEPRRDATVGFAWAAPREILDRHGFYDACILGGGDKAMVSAAFGDFQSPLAIRSNELAGDHYLSWARGLFDAVRGKIGYVPGTLLHLWHGRSLDRGYYRRYADFQRFGFDPNVHIELDPRGGWCWASPPAGMREYVRDYFESRQEDRP